MTVRTHVFTKEDGSQLLLVVYPDDRYTIAERGATDHSWGPPIREDLWYRGTEQRSVEEVVSVLLEWS